MKQHLLLLLFSFSLSGCHAQDNQKTTNKKTMDLSFIDNKKTKYSIVMMACRTCAPISNLGPRVVVKLSPEEQDKIKNIRPETWLKLLNGNSTDFSANLMLYSLYSKDAFMLSQNNSEELWHKYLKKEDIEFWNSEFKRAGKLPIE